MSENKNEVKNQSIHSTVTVRSKRGSKANFTQVSNDAIYDVGLSTTARHLLTTLLSFPEYYHCKKTDTIKEWKIIDDYLMELLVCKERRLQEAFRELRVAGYVTLLYPRDKDGKINGSRREFDYYPIFSDLEGTPERKIYDDKRSAFDKKHKNKESEPIGLNDDFSEEFIGLNRERVFLSLGKTHSHINNKKSKDNTDSIGSNFILKQEDPTKEILSESELENCVTKEVLKVSNSTPLGVTNGSGVTTGNVEAKPEAITATKTSQPGNKYSQNEIVPQKPLRAANLAFSSGNKTKIFSDQVSWAELPAEIHDYDVEDRLKFINLEKAKIDGQSFAPKELVAKYGEGKLAMVWADMKGYVAENADVCVKNVAGLFLKRLRQTEAMLVLATARSV